MRMTLVKPYLHRLVGEIVPQRWRNTRVGYEESPRDFSGEWHTQGTLN